MMTKRHTPGGEALTDLVLAVFRLNGRLLAAGDHLVSDLGLTSARWQVLGAIAHSAKPAAGGVAGAKHGIQIARVFSASSTRCERTTSSSCAPTRTTAAPISLR